MKWSAGTALGTHEIWVGILPHADDQIANDNYAYKTVEFAPYRANLHFIGKQ